MTAYDIVQIPGWENVSLLDADAAERERRLDELAHDAVPDEVPRDSAAPFRGELRRHLARLVAQARSAGAAMVCLPVQRMGELAVPASYTVSEWLDPHVDASSPDELLAALARDSAAEVSIVDIDGQPALREEAVQPADTQSDVLAGYAGRRVTYTIPSPDVLGTWLVFAFVTIGDGDARGALADVLVELFDAQMGTVRWR